MSPINIQLFNDEDIEGISLVENPYFVTRFTVRLGRFARAWPQFLGIPVPYPFQLTTFNIHYCFKTEPYVISPKPEGV